MADFERALSEIKPAFGAVTETLEQYRLNGIIDSGEKFRHLQSTCRNLVEQVSIISHDTLVMMSHSKPPCPLINCRLCKLIWLLCQISSTV